MIIAKSNAEKQHERAMALKVAAQAAGYSSWAAYCTAVIHGRVKVARLPRRWINARGKRKNHVIPHSP